MSGLLINPYAFRFKGTVYEDDFSGAVGTSLNGRSPNLVNVTGNTYTTQSGGLELSGGGLLWAVGDTTTSAYAIIELPSVRIEDTIKMEMVIRPRGNANNWMGVGLHDGSSVNMQNRAAAWSLLRGQPEGRGGQIAVYSGRGTNGVLYTSTATESGFEGANPSTLTLTYTVSAGNLKVELGGITKHDGVIAYQNIANTPAPLSAITHVVLQFNAQYSSTHLSALPAYVDYLKVSYL
jgi:hypothetical protein